jgi:transposase
MPEWSLAPVVQALQAMRGVQLVAAMTLVAELQDFLRFDNPRQLMAYVGLVPGEHSSGPKRRQGSITKAGNSAARRMLVEVARHYQHSPRVSPIIATRQDPLPGGQQYEVAGPGMIEVTEAKTASVSRDSQDMTSCQS